MSLCPFFRLCRLSALDNRRSGFAIAPILYLLGLIGVGAGVLFSGYSQILRSNQTMTNSLSVKNDLQGSATTLAASSWLSTDQTLLCPPLAGSNSPNTPSVKCSGAAGAITVGTAFASATAANLPANTAAVSTTGSPVEVGVFKAGAGAKVLDPWGHYYVYCRWENAIGTANAIMIISAGADGVLQTKCGDTSAQGDDMLVVWTTAVAQNRAAVWQTTSSGTAVTGTQFGATGTQVSLDTAGDVTIPGTLGVTGATTIGTGGLNVTGSTTLSGTTNLTGTTNVTGNLVATDGSFSGTLGVTGLSTLGQVSAGTSTLSAATITNNATVGGTLGVTGATTLGTSSVTALTVTGTTFQGGNLTTSNGFIQIGTSVVASGSSSPLLTIGKGVGSPAVYPYTVDQFGAATGSSFTGNLNGSQSGGSVSATTIAASGDTTLSGKLSVTGATTLTGQFISNSTSVATFAGPVSATSYSGSFALSGGSGPTITGVLPIANGGTGQSSAASALSGLFGSAGTIAGMIPGADLVSGTVTATQLNTTGVTPGTYSSVTVAADGRVTAASGSGTASTITDGGGDTITVGTSGGITFTVGGTTQGNWTSNGLMIGTSKAPLDKLDVYGATAIGTSYAGTTAAPANGLIVQGQVAIGTSSPLGALNVNGTVSATNFSGSGAGLTNIGTTSLSGTVGTSNGGTGTNTIFTQGSVVYAGASGIYSQDNSNFFWDGTNHRLGIGTATPQATLAINGSAAFLLGADYTTTGSQSDVNLGGAATIRYNGSAAATFYGILAGSNGQIIHLHNASSTTLILSNLSGSEATAANQIITGSGADLAMQANSAVILQYDTTAAKWRVIGGGSASGPGLAGQAAFYATTGNTVVGTSAITIVGGSVGIGTSSPSGLLHVNGTLHLTGVAGGIGSASGAGIITTSGYTVATLPAGTVGMRAYITDAVACTFNAALTGGGAITCPVFYNGSAWVGG